jgi:hypothetical protein
MMAQQLRPKRRTRGGGVGRTHLVLGKARRHLMAVCASHCCGGCSADRTSLGSSSPVTPPAHPPTQPPADANQHHGPSALRGSRDGPLSATPAATATAAAAAAGQGVPGDLDSLRAAIASKKAELAPKVQQLRTARERFQVGPLWPTWGTWEPECGVYMCGEGQVGRSGRASRRWRQAMCVSAVGHRVRL